MQQFIRFKSVLMYRYKVKLYRYIDVSWLVLMKLLYIVVNLNGTRCFSMEKASFISLKSNTEQYFDSAFYQTIYCCIVIHQRQYINASTHFIIATLLDIVFYIEI